SAAKITKKPISSRISRWTPAVIRSNGSEFPDAAAQILLLHGIARQSQRAIVFLKRIIPGSHPPQNVGTRSVVEIVIFQLLLATQFVDPPEALFKPVTHRYSDCPVQRHDGGRIAVFQFPV